MITIHYRKFYVDTCVWVWLSDNEAINDIIFNKVSI